MNDKKFSLQLILEIQTIPGSEASARSAACVCIPHTQWVANMYRTEASGYGPEMHPSRCTISCWAWSQADFYIGVGITTPSALATCSRCETGCDWHRADCATDRFLCIAAWKVTTATAATGASADSWALSRCNDQRYAWWCLVAAACAVAFTRPAQRQFAHTLDCVDDQRLVRLAMSDDSWSVRSLARLGISDEFSCCICSALWLASTRPRQPLRHRAENQLTGPTWPYFRPSPSARNSMRADWIPHSANFTWMQRTKLR